MRSDFSSLYLLAAATLSFSIPSFANNVSAPGMHEKHELMSFSYFGLGLDSMTYKESTNAYGMGINTKSTASVPVQRSGAYTAINDQWGFGIFTVSSLYGEDNPESWKTKSFGTVQTNDVSLKRTDVTITGVRQIDDGHYLSGGFNYSDFSFVRSNFKKTSTSDALANSVNATFDLPQGAISEESVALNLMLGYGYDDYFRFENEGLRTFASIQAGVPLFRRVSNTNNNNPTLTDFLASGYKAQLAAGLGWQFSEKLSVNYISEYSYTKLGEMQEANVIMPESTLTNWNNSIIAYWNF